MKKVFIITGTNRGLGKALVDVLIKNKDYFVISISRNVSEPKKAYSAANFYYLKADLSENMLVEKISVLKELISKQEICFINNASIIEPITEIEKLDEKAIDTTITVNIKSPMLIVQYLLNNFKSNSLSFVNISSGAANKAISNWSLYCCSKAFIKMFFNVAEIEYKQHRFFNIDPGVMDTNMQELIRTSDFPDVSDFQNLEKEGKLRSTKDVAIELLKTIS